MPNINTPYRTSKTKEIVTPHIQRELDARVRETNHLPDSDKRKYRVNITVNLNNAVKRIKEGG